MSWLITPGQPVPIDPSRSNVSLLLHGNGTNGSTTITDNSPTTKTVTAVGNAQISTAIADPFGNSSKGVIAFDGSGDYLTASSNAGFAFGSGDFTVEAWVRPTTLSLAYDFAMVFDTRAVAGSPNQGILVAFTNATGVWIFYESTQNAIITTSSSAVVNQWQHIALSRSSTTWRFFVDGTQSGTLTNGANLGTFQPLLIGTARDTPDSDRNFPGYIDDFRITKGVARYTGDFTPPTAPFPDF
jgi:hypothetical protein